MGLVGSWDPEGLQGEHVRTVRQAKIIGGNLAEPNEFPHQVHLSYNENMVCGGTIISTFFILTAAHCVKFKIPNRFKVTAGDHHRFYPEGTEQERNVSHIYMHEDYNWDTDQNDIALLVLSEPLEFNEFVQNISYPKSRTEFTGRATVTGWGKTKEGSLASDILQKVSIPIVPRSECQKNYRRLRMIVTDQMLCAGTRGFDSCQGDSGGPLTCTDKRTGETVLCGIVSHGVGCGRIGYPGVNTDVSQYSDWIERTILKYNIRGKCSTNRFYCPENNSCIDRKLVCDEIPHCPSGSDEKLCKSYRSTPKFNFFRCNNGMSIKSSWVCDNFDDCGDHSDEDKCSLIDINGTCIIQPNFSCRKDNRCIDLSWKCDGLIDCDDGSDEAHCGNNNPNPTPPEALSTTTTSRPRSTSPTSTTTPASKVCKRDEFQCLSSLCIPLKWKCDGDIDCARGEDEIDCDNSINFLNSTYQTPPTRTRPSVTPRTTTTTTTNAPETTTSRVSTTTQRNNCKQDQFHCPGIRGGYCIPIAFKCDGDNDCIFGQDEANCHNNNDNRPGRNVPRPMTISAVNNAVVTTTTMRPMQSQGCSSREFRCGNGDCISKIFVCDGDNDCEDKSDEVGCKTLASTCSPFQWRCNNGDCIYHRYRCDNDIDCIDKSDEEGCSLGDYMILIASID